MWLLSSIMILATTWKPPLFQDKGTMGQGQNLFTGWAGFWHFVLGRTRIGRNFDILPWDKPGRDFDSLSRPILQYPGTATGQKEKKRQRIFEKKKILKIFDFFWCFLTRDKKTVKQGNFFCPGTKGQQDKETFLSQDVLWDVPSLGNPNWNCHAEYSRAWTVLPANHEIRRQFLEFLFEQLWQHGPILSL